MALDNSGKVALVTGASRGIGRFIALRLAGDGYRVAVGCRQVSPAAEGVVEEIRRGGGQAVVAAGDLGDETQIGRMVQGVQEQLGDVSVLVHNAAPVRRGYRVTECPTEELDLHYRAGPLATMALARLVVPAMRERRFGRIVLITTTSTRLYVPGFGAYCAAKGAMEVLAHYLAAEEAAYGITVNVVAPGLTMKEKKDHPEAERFPMGRPAHAEDIAEIVSMLCQEHAQSMTGLVVPVDGGLRLLEPLRGNVPPV